MSEQVLRHFYNSPRYGLLLAGTIIHDAQILPKDALFDTFELLKQEIQEALLSVQQTIVDPDSDQLCEQSQNCLLQVRAHAARVQLQALNRTAQSQSHVLPSCISDSRQYLHDDRLKVADIIRQRRFARRILEQTEHVLVSA